MNADERRLPSEFDARARVRTFKAVVQTGPEGRWTLTVPALPGYVAFGDSEEDVLDLAREGIPFHLACLRGEGRDVPEDEGDAKVIEIEVAA